MLGLTLPAGCSTPGAPSCNGDESTPGAYRLGPRDQLQVTVFRQPDMSGQFTIDGRGFLHLPLVGEFKAEGLTTSELEDEIETRLKEDHFLVGPQVSLQVQTYRPFYVLGEFANPGSYEYRDGMTVAEALAVAGGNTYRRTHQV